MAKMNCAICGSEIGFLTGKIKISDGAVCKYCLNNAGMSTVSNAGNYDHESIRELLDAHKELAKSFSSTKNVGSYIQVDENNRLFKVGEDVFRYENLLSFELLEDGDSITKGGLGRAVAGGLLFGGVGAVVGGVTGKKKNKSVCTSMKMRVSLKNAHTDVVYMHFISTQTKTSGILYKAAQNSAQQCITALEVINDINQTSQFESEPVSQPAVSAADEILKFKSLCDQGIITQEEFEAKKKQLLGL